MRLTRMTILAGMLLCSAVAAGAEPPKATLTPRQGREPSPAVVHPALRSPLRQTVSLNGTWDFCTDPKLQGEAAGWQLPGKGLPSARRLQVPGCWEAQGVGEPGLSSANNTLVYEPTNVKLHAAYTVPVGTRRKLRFHRIGLASRYGSNWVA